MNKTSALKYFNGSKTELARALGISSSAVSQWPEKIPALRAYQLEEITKGALKANSASLAHNNNI